MDIAIVFAIGLATVLTGLAAVTISEIYRLAQKLTLTPVQIP